MAIRASHQALREATRDAHETLDAVFAGFDLAQRGSYADFLSAHAQALLPIERALDAADAARITPDWPERRRVPAIVADLADLGRSPDAGAPFVIAADDDAAVAGALYVLEGSRLGGRFLARQVAADLPRRYLDPGQASGKWPFLLDRIDTRLYDDATMSRALVSARNAFAMFERAGRDWLAKA